MQPLIKKVIEGFILTATVVYKKADTKCQTVLEKNKDVLKCAKLDFCEIDSRCPFAVGQISLYR